MFLSTERRKAGSVHICRCGKRIEKGERYTREFGVDEEGVFSSKVSDEHVHSFEEEDYLMEPEEGGR